MTLSKFDESSFRKVDIDSDEGSTLSAQYNVRSLPTTLLLDGDGNVVEAHNRLLSPSQFKELLNKKGSV
jgi:thioredoxin-like negative regulator of GroEL